MYAQAAAESTLTDRLRSASYHSGLAFLGTTFGNYSPAIDTARQTVRRHARVRGYGKPIGGASVAVTAKVPGAPFTTVSTLVTRDGVCGHLVLVRGRCATHVGEAIVPEESAATNPRWTPGKTLTIHQLVIAPDGIV